MTYETKWGQAPRSGANLNGLGKVRNAKFESDFFSVDCLDFEFEKKVVRYVASNRLAAKRVHSLMTKEPTTIPWLETFTQDDVFFDIGANVGMYSIFASAVTGCRTYGFEPEALNYGELNKNIFINRLHSRVTAYNIAISNEVRVGELFLGAFGYSYSHHDFNESTWAEDHFFGDKSTKISERLHQGCVSLPIDDLVMKHGLPQPNHIKIDVDGLEDRVFAGMRQVLRAPELKSVLIEIDFQHEKCAAIIDEMLAEGWRYSLAQLRTNRKVIFTEDEIKRMRAKKKGGLNYIFYKDDFYDRYFEQFLKDYVPPLAVKA